MPYDWHVQGIVAYWLKPTPYKCVNRVQFSAVLPNGMVAELVDAPDLKSVGSIPVRVQVPLILLDNLTKVW